MFKRTTKFTHCLKFIQILALCLPTLLSAGELSAEKVLKSFNPNHQIQDRSPDSYIVDVDYTPQPEKKKIWLNYVLVEDDAGVLAGIRNDLKRWEENEEYMEFWDVDYTGKYEVASTDQKKNYLGKRILKYVDKRISGEVKSAEKGSTLASIGQAQKALKPNTSVSVSKNIAVKFKARVLQGKAIMMVKNPYVDCNASYSYKYGLVMNAKKEIEATRTVASVEYRATEGNYITSLNQEITKRVSATVSSTQESKHGIFTKDSDSRLYFQYTAPFNF